MFFPNLPIRPGYPQSVKNQNDRQSTRTNERLWTHNNINMLDTMGNPILLFKYSIK